jgi:hypothetical protein
MKCNFHEPRGTTYGSDAIHHPCGCAVLKTDRLAHRDDPNNKLVLQCGGADYCYWCHEMCEFEDGLWDAVGGRVKKP